MKRIPPFLAAGAFLLIVPLAGLACNLPTVAATETPAQPTLAASAATPPPAATADPAACLAGTWDVGDLGPYIKDAIPPDQLQGATLEPKGYTGSFHYRFNPDGSVVAEARDYKLSLGVKMGILPLTLEVAIDGKTSASYSVFSAKSWVSFSKPDTSGLNVAVTMAGQSLIDPAQILPYVWFGASADKTVTLGYRCGGDTLTVTVPQSDGTETPLFTLQRVAP